jgi:feruloyl esterase
MDGQTDRRDSHAAPSPTRDRAPPPDRLRVVEDFDPNPGNLVMRLFRPDSVRKNPALVVVLHGCLQTAEGYDKGSGWSKLAERCGFILLYPEQRHANNPRNCFNWFDPKDSRRDHGEVRSIRAMITKAVAVHGVDTRRVFICGLSAGGAMTGAMLAAYPDVFRAGAIIAGLPYGTASTTSEALESMFTGRLKPARTWGDVVRAASPHTGPWPSVAIWHGMADTTVKPINAGEIVKQWTDVHGLGSVTPDTERLGAITRRVWRDGQGHARVLEYAIPGMGHGTPVEGIGAIADGTVGPFFLAAGLWSSLRIAQDWDLVDAEGRPRKRRRFSFLGFSF